jgi:hypothetical protein
MGNRVVGRFTDLGGQVFGRWTVLAIHPKLCRSSSGYYYFGLWTCVCACGTRRLVRGDGLREGRSTNCGCVRREKLRKLATTHGMTGTRAYYCWQDILQRCFNPRDAWYHCYGARGITVCDEWLSFENFYADMGDPPDGLSIDRINNDGNYEPGNCRWATRAVQNANRRPTKRKKRRATVAELRAYTDALARAASPSGSVRAAS